MRIRSRSRQLFGMWVLPVALWAALPAIRWCPPGWKQACAAALLRCSAMQSPAACTGAHDGCPLATAAASAVAHDACPSGSGCPMAPAARGPTTPQRDPFPAGGAFCVGDPNGGSALRAHAPQLYPAANLLAIVSDTGIGPRADTRPEPVPQLASRPPPRPWFRRPPARAPPSLPLT